MSGYTTHLKVKLRTQNSVDESDFKSSGYLRQPNSSYLFARGKCILNPNFQALNLNTLNNEHLMNPKK